MPATHAHYLFGCRVRDRLSGRCRDIVDRYPDLYHIGLHGPDLLFYYHPLRVNKINDLGISTHTLSGREFFGRQADMIRQREKRGQEIDAHLAYLYGFLCHFSLDRECHWFIYQHIGKTGISHTAIEMEFDRMLLVKEGADPLRQSVVNHIRPDAASAPVIADFYPGVTAEQIYRSEKSFVSYNRKLIAPGKLKRNFVFLVLRLTGNYETMHGCMISLRPDPRCRESSLKLSTLFEEAVPHAVSLIKGWSDTMAGKIPWDELYNYNFNSELVEKPAAPAQQAADDDRGGQHEKQAYAGGTPVGSV